MKKTFSLLGLSSGIFLLVAFNFPKDSLDKVFQEINQEVLTHGRSYETLGEATSTIGHRLTGSENGKKAEAFAYDLLKSYGFENVKYMPFEVESWSRDTVTLEIAPKSSDNFRDVKVVSLAHSPVNAHTKNEIIDCGDGLDDDFEKVKDKIKGKAALMNINIQLPENKGKKNLHRSEKTALAIKYGAASVIIANSVQGGILLTGTASVTGELIPIPAVCISLESGRAIRKWLKDEGNLLAMIDMQNYSKLIKARNVIASLSGDKKYSKEKIIVSAHLDSWDLATGAIDNGIGSFSIIDVARTFKALNLKTKRPIEFVLFMGEEEGLLGSKAMVKKYKNDKNLDQVGMVINLDMVNNIKGFNAFGRPELKQFFDEIGKKINEIDTTFTNTNPSEASLHSDHEVFMLEGVSVTEPFGHFPLKTYDCYHASCDRFDLIDKTHITNNVRFTAMMLYALANADALPAKRLNSTQTRDYLIKQNLKNELVIGKEWKW